MVITKTQYETAKFLIRHTLNAEVIKQCQKAIKDYKKQNEVNKEHNRKAGD